LIAVDTTILIYAHREDSPFHKASAGRIAELAERVAAWAIPWPCLHEFLAIATHLRIFSPPGTLEEAFDQVDAWLASPSVTLLVEPTIHDGRIAALCRQHGVRELWTADRDFSCFPGVTVVNPLVKR
jgi:predicted nucleic acid-binding protein